MDARNYVPKGKKTQPTNMQRPQANRLYPTAQAYTVTSRVNGTKKPGTYTPGNQA